MKKLKKVLIILILVELIIIESSYAQPKIPKENIPTDISYDVRKEIEKLYSSNPVERGYGAMNLGKMGRRAVSAVPFLIAILDDETDLSWVSSPSSSLPLATTTPGIEAGEALGKIKDSQTVDALIFALKDKNWIVQRRAALALGEIKDGRAVEPLIVALKKKDPTLQYPITEALRMIKDPSSIEPLIALMKDQDYSMRESAVMVLGEINDPRVVDALIFALKDKDWRIQSKAAKALCKITGQEFGEDHSKWQEWWEKSKTNFGKFSR